MSVGIITVLPPIGQKSPSFRIKWNDSLNPQFTLNTTRNENR
jgi:hypothetical protein